MTTTVRLLICDDHAVVRAGLHALLSSAPDIEVIGEAADGPTAVTLAASLRPDVVLMDLQLGKDMDGVEATRRITAQPAPTDNPIAAATAAASAADAPPVSAPATAPAPAKK